MKVKRALASTFLRGEVTSEWKSKVALGKHDLRIAVDIQVKELQSSYWRRARRYRNKHCRSGNGTSRSISRGGGEGKSWRGVVEAAAEVRLNNLHPFQAPIYPRMLEE